MLSVSPVQATLHAQVISHALGDRVVLRDVSILAGPDARIGVVGPNGVGKSTLLCILAGLKKPDAGTVDLAPRSATVGYLAQEPQRSSTETVGEQLRRLTSVSSANAAFTSATEALVQGEPGAEAAYAEALERWQSVGAADFDARLDRVMSELGLHRDVLSLPTGALSGGQAARAALAAVLLSRFDITLLDEPTNDLDFAGIEVLERFVATRPGGMVIVSHDRAFLERSITSVLELDEHDHTARLYRGGWAAYLEERAADRRHAEEDYLVYEARRQTLIERARRERQWATRGVARDKRAERDNNKMQRDSRINRTEQLASRARRTEKALARLDVVEKPWQGWKLQFTISEAPRAGAVVVRLAAAVVERGSFCLGPIDVEIGWGERVALRGPNGAGKTTLLMALLGYLPLVSGERWLGPSVVVGELGQGRQALNKQGSLLDAFMASTGLTASDSRSLLAKFGLEADHVMRLAASLSPGERTRAELASFQARGVNLLVLDEPTNHLDLPAVEQLEEALAGYAGTLIVVSHDRKLLETVELTRTIEVGT